MCTSIWHYQPLLKSEWDFLDLDSQPENIGDIKQSEKNIFQNISRGCPFLKPTIRGYGIRFPFNQMLRRQNRMAASYLCFCIYSSAWVPLIWKKSKISIFERFAFASKTADSDVPQHSRDKSVWHISYSTLQITSIFWENVGCCGHVPKLNWWGHHQFENRGVTDGTIVHWKFQCNENHSLRGNVSVLLHHAKQMAQSWQNKINHCIHLTCKKLRAKWLCQHRFDAINYFSVVLLLRSSWPRFYYF